MKPTAFLPQLKRHGGHPANADGNNYDADVRTALHRLEGILTDRDRADSLDDFERQHAQQWLQRLLKVSENADDADLAARLLTALTSPDAASDGQTKAFEFEILDDPNLITVKIQETHMGDDVHATGFCTWSSATHLCRLIAANPSDYSPNLSSNADHVRPLNILELGSGTGLVGIALAKLMHRMRLPAAIVLSDYDVATLELLRDNLRLNALGVNHESNVCTDSPVTVQVMRLDWREAVPEHLAGSVDVVLGADIVYEREHPELLHRVIGQLLARPSGVCHLVIPLRSTHEDDVRDLERRFSLDSAGSGCRIVSKREIPQSSDEQYQHRSYRIEWCQTL